MIPNKIILAIIAITSIITIPIQLVTTFVLGILVSLTFGLLLIPISFIWLVLFFGPLMGLSYTYDKIIISRPLIAIIGIPLAVLGNTYVASMPSMGEWESRYIKLILCQTFPYTWRFMQFKSRKLSVRKLGVLSEIFREVSKAKPLGQYIESLEIEAYNKEV